MGPYFIGLLLGYVIYIQKQRESKESHVITTNFDLHNKL
jgi:hypothetical protein